MKGIVYNLLEQVLTAEYGEECWDLLLQQTGLDGVYTSLGAYPDEQLFQLIGAGSKMLDRSPDELVRWFARQALPLIAAKFPLFFERHTCTRSFLLTLNSVIHPEVRKVFPGADPPVFHFDASQPDKLILHYNSRRRLCTFALGMIEGAAEHYAEELTFTHPTCMHRGDEKCSFHLSFQPR